MKRWHSVFFDALDRLFWRGCKTLPPTAVAAIGWLGGVSSGLRFIVFRRSWCTEIRAALALTSGDDRLFPSYRKLFSYFGNLGQVALETAVLGRLLLGGRVAIAGRHNALDAGRPTIFVGAHLSNWELTAVLTVILGVPGVILYWSPGNKVRRDIIDGLRRDIVKRAPATRLVAAGPQAMRTITKAVAAGENLLIFADELKDGVVWGPGLGRDLPYQGNRVLAARLAVKYGASVVPLVVRRCGFARYECVIEPALEPPADFEGEDRVRYLADAIDARIEHWVRSYPEQWFWLGDLIRSRGYVIAFPWKGEDAE